jgi:hypothetical protein
LYVEGEEFSYRGKIEGFADNHDNRVGTREAPVPTCSIQLAPEIQANSQKLRAKSSSQNTKSPEVVLISFVSASSSR